MEEKCFVFFLATCEHQWLHQGIKAIFIYIYFKGIKPFLRTTMLRKTNQGFLGARHSSEHFMYINSFVLCHKTVNYCYHFHFINRESEIQ